jgi:hypothetical protein
MSQDALNAAHPSAMGEPRCLAKASAEHMYLLVFSNVAYPRRALVRLLMCKLFDPVVLWSSDACTLSCSCKGFRARGSCSLSNGFLPLQ